MLRKLKSLFISAIAIIFTIFIAFHWSISLIIVKLLALLPLNLISELAHSLKVLNPKNIKLSNCIQLIANSCLSMVSALLIMNYSQKFIKLIEFISHETHRQFLSLVHPQIPELWLYRPPYLPQIFVFLGYLGLSVQIAFTLDMIYLFTIPTIFMYKILALSYQQLIKSIKFIYQILTIHPKQWITCQSSLIKNGKYALKVFSLALLIVLVEILLFVSFYYLWLAIVIVGLTISLKIINKILIFIKSIGIFISIIKGYHPQSLTLSKIHLLKRQIFQKLFSGKIINARIIHDIFVGKDLLLMPNPIKHCQYQLSLLCVYQTFTKQ